MRYIAELFIFSFLSLEILFICTKELLKYFWQRHTVLLNNRVKIKIVLNLNKVRYPVHCSFIKTICHKQMWKGLLSNTNAMLIIPEVF